MRIVTYPVLIHAHVFVSFINLSHHSLVSVLHRAAHLLLYRWQLSGVYHPGRHLLRDIGASLDGAMSPSCGRLLI